jgi:hypothetical protein
MTMEGVTKHSELSAEDRAYVDHVERWWKEKGIDLECAACKGTSWIAMRILAAPVTDLAQITYGDADRMTAHLLAPVGCRNCGFVVFFNAIMMGLPFEHVIIADGAAGAC